MLAQAWTEDDDVCIEFTAVQDERAQQYFNISTQSSDVRKEFRTKHTDGTYYGSSGYTYESGDWKTIKGAGKMLLLTYRYISVMAEEVSIMTQAYSLRAPAQRGIHYSAWGSFLGQLLLRSMDRAQELYESMLLRGYHGAFFYAKAHAPIATDFLYALLWCAFFLLCRRYNLTQLLGQILT